jgi:hypothetical protein
MQLTQILARSPALAATHRHVHDFAETVEWHLSRIFAKLDRVISGFRRRSPPAVS